jgi:ubiquitin carboxyl-terminal hydrolase 5/13
MEKAEAKEVPLESASGKYKLHGMVTHLGANATSGHYIAHVKKEEKWVYYNDLKVAEVEDPMFQLGTMYFYIAK